MDVNDNVEAWNSHVVSNSAKIEKEIPDTISADSGDCPNSMALDQETSPTIYDIPRQVDK